MDQSLIHPPRYLDQLPTAVQNIMTHVVRQGLLPDLEMTTVRGAGQGFWLDIPLMGPKSVSRLGRVVGGWPGLPAIELQRIEQQIRGVRHRLDVLEAAFSDLLRSQSQ